MRYLFTSFILFFGFNFLFAQSVSKSVLLKSGKINLNQSFDISTETEEIVNQKYSEK